MRPRRDHRRGRYRLIDDGQQVPRRARGALLRRVVGQQQPRAQRCQRAHPRCAAHRRGVGRADPAHLPHDGVPGIAPSEACGDDRRHRFRGAEMRGLQHHGPAGNPPCRRSEQCSVSTAQRRVPDERQTRQSVRRRSGARGRPHRRDAGQRRTAPATCGASAMCASMRDWPSRGSTPVSRGCRTGSATGTRSERSPATSITPCSSRMRAKIR